jgi:hypothetical protein
MKNPDSPALAQVVVSKTTGTKYVFAHVPKTGGTALSYLISRNCVPGEVVTEFPGCRIDALGYFVRPDVEDYIRRMSSVQLEKCRIFSGHLPVGLDADLYTPFRYINMLRDPIDRMISGFLYGTPGTERLPVEQLLFGLHRSVSICGSVGFDNPLTRALSGRQELNPLSADTASWEVPPVTRDDRELAIRRLNTQFEFVGLTERFDDSCRMILSLLGKNTATRASRLNQTKASLPRAKLPRATLRAMERHLQHDAAVFSAGREIFNRHAARHGLQEVGIVSPESYHGPFSSGDHAHVTSCDDAFYGDREGVWISHPHSSNREFIGYEFPIARAISSFEMQLVDGLGISSVEFALEASDDDFHRDIREISRQTIPADGMTHRSKASKSKNLAKSWRVRSCAIVGSGPLSIAYVSFASSDEPRAERDVEAIRIKVRRALTDFNEVDYVRLLAQGEDSSQQMQASD